MPDHTPRPVILKGAVRPEESKVPETLDSSGRTAPFRMTTRSFYIVKGYKWENAAKRKRRR